MAIFAFCYALFLFALFGFGVLAWEPASPTVPESAHAGPWASQRIEMWPRALRHPMPHRPAPVAYQRRKVRTVPTAPTIIRRAHCGPLPVETVRAAVQSTPWPLPWAPGESRRLMMRAAARRREIERAQEIRRAASAKACADLISALPIPYPRDSRGRFVRRNSPLSRKAGV